MSYSRLYKYWKSLPKGHWAGESNFLFSTKYCKIFIFQLMATTQWDIFPPQWDIYPLC